MTRWGWLRRRSSVPRTGTGPRQLVIAFAMIFGLGVSHPAAAQLELKLLGIGSILALPVMTTTSSQHTFATVTNHGASARTLLLYVIDGDTWKAPCLMCDVTAGELVLLHFAPESSGGSRLTFECNFGGAAIPAQRSIPLVQERGVLLVALANPGTTMTTNANDITGESRIVDFDQGEAYSLRAVAFRGLNPLATGVEDKTFVFDNEEYSMFSDQLMTPFAAETPEVTNDLILFALDGSPGIPPGPQASVSIDFYDDDETSFSTSFSFDRFAVVSLKSIDARFDAGVLGSSTGWLFISPLATAQSDGTHDFVFGSADDIRTTGVHGWLVNHSKGQIRPSLPLLAGPASSGGRLDESAFPQPVSPGDVPAFDGSAYEGE